MAVMLKVCFILSVVLCGSIFMTIHGDSEKYFLSLQKDLLSSVFEGCYVCL